MNKKVLISRTARFNPPYRVIKGASILHRAKTRDEARKFKEPGSVIFKRQPDGNYVKIS
jgi:hypothetical protein